VLITQFVFSQINEDRNCCVPSCYDVIRLTLAEKLVRSELALPHRTVIKNNEIEPKQKKTLSREDAGQVLVCEDIPDGRRQSKLVCIC